MASAKKINPAAPAVLLAPPDLGKDSVAPSMAGTVVRPVGGRRAWAPLVVVCLGLLGALGAAAGARVARSEDKPDAIPSTGAFSFLRQFGYLGSFGAAELVTGDRFGVVSSMTMSRPDSANLYTKEAVKGAIRMVQKFGSIPQTGVLDEATKALMTAKRCGCPDVGPGAAVDAHGQHRLQQHGQRSKRFAIVSSGWQKRHLKYYIENTSSSGMTAESVDAEVRRAFDAWCYYGRLTYSRARSASDADIAISFTRGDHGDGFHFDGRGLTLAHAFFPQKSSRLGGDIHFDDDEEWAVSPNATHLEAGALDFFMVAVHELGHSLGLGHSPDPSSIMFPYYDSRRGSFMLGYDDIKAMHELYIKRHIEEEYETSDTSYSEEPSTTRRSTTRKQSQPSPRRPRPTTAATTTTTPRPPHRPYTTTRRPPPTSSGDDKTKDKNKEHDHRRRTPPVPADPNTTEDKIPNLCAGHYDAVAQLRGELFVFKGEYLWRLQRRGEVTQGYPVRHQRMFRDLTDYGSKLDTVYQREDGNIVLFSGTRDWVYDGGQFIENSPQNIARYDLPRHIDHVDAVMVWPKNSATYIFKGSEYWRYNATTSRMDRGYPKRIADNWIGVPDDLDDVMTWTDDTTYFFKGREYFKLDDEGTRVETRGDAPRFWFGCP